MRSYALVAVLAGVAATSNIAMSLGGSHLSFLPRDIATIGLSPALNNRATTCAARQTACGPGCMDLGATCCSEASGAYCTQGYYCQQNVLGCCPDGTTCSGTPDACPPGKVKCGNGCMSTDAVCCNDGSICAPGVSCGSSTCVAGGGPSSGGGSSSNNADQPSTGTTGSRPSNPATPGSGNINAPGLLVALFAVLPLIF